MEKFKTDLLKDASGSEKLFPLSLESFKRPKYSRLKENVLSRIIYGLEELIKSGFETQIASVFNLCCIRT